MRLVSVRRQFDFGQFDRRYLLIDLEVELFHQLLVVTALVTPELGELDGFQRLPDIGFHLVKFTGQSFDVAGIVGGNLESQVDCFLGFDHFAVVGFGVDHRLHLLHGRAVELDRVLLDHRHHERGIPDHPLELVHISIHIDVSLSDPIAPESGDTLSFGVDPVNHLSDGLSFEFGGNRVNLKVENLGQGCLDQISGLDVAGRGQGVDGVLIDQNPGVVAAGISDLDGIDGVSEANTVRHGHEDHDHDEQLH